MNQLMISVAFGHSSISTLRLPVWSMSSWLMNTQRTSSGSTRLDTSLKKCSRCSAMPVSTTTGSAAPITIVFRATLTGASPSPWWLRRRKVSDAIGVGGMRVLRC